MSGGSLDYFYYRLEEHVGDFKDKELDDLVKDLAQLFHDREWYLSGDTGEGNWNEARDKFKEKWFTPLGREERIEQYLDELKKEVMQSFGLDNKYCESCKHWEKELDSKSDYGHCELTKYCLSHKCDTCEKWESK